MSHPSNGIYEKDGLGYISVSDILGRTMPLFNPSKASGLEYWRQNEPDAIEILERGQRRGTLIHSEVELSLTGHNKVHAKDQPTFEEIMSYNIHAYMTFLNPLLNEIKQQNNVDQTGETVTHDEGVFLIEKKIFSPYGWAGTPDLRLIWDGEYTIWDWKSVRSHLEKGVKQKPKSMSHYAEAFIQIGAYALAHNILAKNCDAMLPITRGVICVCYDWREPHVHVLDKHELKSAADTFVQRYKVYQEITETKFPIKL